MRVSTIDVFAQAVANFDLLESQLAKTESQVASGLAILSAADDPVGMMNMLNYNNQLNQLDRYLSNVYEVENALEFQDSVLNSVTLNYQRLRELLIFAGNAALGSTDRIAIANEMGERLQELISLANTRAGSGEYIFAGYKAATAPVGQSANGFYTYYGDEGQTAVYVDVNSKINTSDSGKTLFFNVPTATIQTITNKGLASYVSPSGGLVNSGTLVPLAANDLIINNIAIPAAISDGVSTTDSASSAISIANAINSQVAMHGVWAAPLANTVNLGVYTPAQLTSGEFTINGVSIVDSIGTENTLMEVIASLSPQTGVTVTQPGGAGTAMILTANDGRNIQLATTGGAAANFSQFNLNAGALNQVMQAQLSYRSHQPFTIGGAFPIHAQIPAGVYSLSLNSGSGIISNGTVINNISDVTQTYSIVFNASGTSFDIYEDSNPLTALTGYANVPYIPGSNIEFAGLSVTLSGTPQAGDVFGIQTKVAATQDIFTSINNFINRLTSAGNSTQFSYEVGVALQNLDNAEAVLLGVRAQVGARLNIAQGKKDYIETISVILAQSLSNVQDLDYSQAITRLSEYTFQLQAAQQSFVKIQSLSIFNYL